MAENANWVLENQDVRGSRVLIWLSLLAIISLIVWASLAWIDEVVRGEGKVVPSR
ncbi:MAG TPA: HlyD family type I secretion periplasmic adaptor subunit, partial [Paenalcaligenes sp.]|nr:HlyD family type I secretion periplasmic adaptor subunit [Paenalcaligenes sp.]